MTKKSLKTFSIEHTLGNVIVFLSHTHIYIYITFHFVLVLSDLFLWCYSRKVIDLSIRGTIPDELWNLAYLFNLYISFSSFYYSLSMFFSFWSLQCVCFMENPFCNNHNCQIWCHVRNCAEEEILIVVTSWFWWLK